MVKNETKLDFVIWQDVDAASNTKPAKHPHVLQEGLGQLDNIPDPQLHQEIHCLDLSVHGLHHPCQGSA